MKKEARAILLPTDKAENAIIKNGDTLYHHKGLLTQDYLKNGYGLWGIPRTSHHLYIVDDSEIKEGDWIIETSNNNLIAQFNEMSLNQRSMGCKKIIGTTNTQLLVQGTTPYTAKEWKSIFELPQLSQSFIESYCKNPVEKVMVEYQERLKFESAEDYTYGCGIELKLTSNNELIIHPIEEKLYTKWELLEAIKDFGYAMYEKHGVPEPHETATYIKENL